MTVQDERATVPKPEQQQTYTVLIAEDLDLEPEEPWTGWREIATVTVEARTKRRTIIAEALAQAGLRPEVGGIARDVRVLDRDSARVISVAPKQREPEWEIGTA